MFTIQKFQNIQYLKSSKYRPGTFASRCRSSWQASSSNGIASCTMPSETRLLLVLYLYCAFLYLYLYFSARARISTPNKYFPSQRSATHLISMRSWALSLTFSGFYQLYFTSHDIVVMVQTKIFGQPPFRIFVYKLYLIFLFLTGLHFTLFELSDKTGTLTRNEMVLKMWVRDGHVCSVEEVLYPLVHLYLFVCILFDRLFRCLFDLGEGRPMAMSVPLKRLFSSLFISIFF